ncbi:MAG: SulP family inorganic anion transporter [Rhodospirillales bacterium]|jgi:sulfate permease, SulP family|nr:SulP family inorganic anion transporter [Rhodospirillales bacterium]
MKLVHGLTFDNIKGDIFGGITAAVVALPLALAFGVASGAGPIAGLYGAIIIGFFAAVFGGTPSQISGPTGPMTVVMTVIIAKYIDQPAAAFTVVIMGGLFQILFGTLRLGRYINLVPFPVISGFMTGIGCIIIILQLAPLLGLSHPGEGVVASLMHLPTDIVSADWKTALVGVLTLAIVYLTPKSIGRIIPTPIIALVAGTAVVWLSFPDTPILGEIPTGFPELHMPVIDLVTWTEMVSSALVLALLGSIDSLLTSLVADGITRTHHESDRELIGQGIGNAIAGLFGAIPGAGATMRTVVNVRAGGKTPISGAVHALVLLGVLFGLGPLASLIPHAVLAGILIKVGIDIIDWGYLKRIPRAPKAGVIIMMVVLGLTVVVDLIVAVSVGIVAASLLFVKRMSDLQLENVRTGADGLPYTAQEQSILNDHADEIMICHISGPMNFGAAKGLTKQIAVTSDFKVLVIDLSDVTFVDTSASMAIEEIMVSATELGLEVILIGIKANVKKTLELLGVTKVIPAEHSFETRMDALRYTAALLDGSEPRNKD